MDDPRPQIPLHVALGLIALATPSFAVAAKIEIRCPHVQEVADEVWNCGANKYAAMEAQACSDQVIDSWNQAAENLKPLLLRDAGGKQDSSETNSRSDYDKALASLDAQIVLMQNYTGLIASYASAGIDFPDGTDDETSAPCFNDAFHKIQDIVTNLDQQIIQAKKVRKLAGQLRGKSDQFHQNLAASLSDAISNGAMASKQGRSENGASDVTGLREAREKARKLEAAGVASRLSKPGGNGVPMGAVAGGPASDITKSPKRHSQEPVRIADAVARTFDGHNKLVPEKAEPGAASSTSVGAALWKDGVGKDKLDLAVGGGAAAGAGAAGTKAGGGGTAGGVSEGSHDVDGSGAAGGGASVAAGASAGNANSSSGSGGSVESSAVAGSEGSVPKADGLIKGSGIARAESDLFALVHDRYRSTELFRKSHVTDVPLGSFDGGLKAK